MMQLFDGLMIATVQVQQIIIERPHFKVWREMEIL